MSEYRKIINTFIGSHDINSMRDMRDALGALGPVNGKQILIAILLKFYNNML